MNAINPVSSDRPMSVAPPAVGADDKIEVIVNGRRMLLPAAAFVAGVREILATGGEYLELQQYAESVAAVFSVLESRCVLAFPSESPIPTQDTSELGAHSHNSPPSLLGE
jgi:hypothetical protein